MHWLNDVTASVTAYINSFPAGGERMAEITAGGIIALFIAWWFWWCLPKRQVARLREIKSPKDRGDLENGFRQTITQTVGGLVVMFGAAFAYVQFREQHNEFEAQQQAARDLLISNQVAKGFEDLGSGQLLVRIGGIYALEAVMNTSPQYHQPVLEGLCAFVRENAKAKAKGPPATDVQAALTVIGRRAAGPGVVDLAGAQLGGAVLQGDFSFANMKKVNVAGVSLERVTLTNANLVEAQLPGANLYDVDLANSNLTAANLTLVNLNGANLTNADLIETDLSYGSFYGANFTDARLWNANFTGSSFRPFLEVSLADPSVRKVQEEDPSLFTAPKITLIHQTQLDDACGAKVALPAGMNIKPCPPSWPFALSYITPPAAGAIARPGAALPP